MKTSNQEEIYPATLQAKGNKKIPGERIRERERKRDQDLISSINCSFPPAQDYLTQHWFNYIVTPKDPSFKKCGQMANFILSLEESRRLLEYIRDQETLMNMFAETTSLSEEKRTATHWASGWRRWASLK